jgi:hypothetical protein
MEQNQEMAFATMLPTSDVDTSSRSIRCPLNFGVFLADFFVGK